MPAHLDLTLSSPYSGMSTLLSPNTAPRMTLRRVASYNSLEKSPQSSTSSRFNFDKLVHTPPPSPGLPALLPRHGKKQPTTSPQRCVRMFLWLLGVAAIVYFAFGQITQSTAPKVGWSMKDKDQYEMIEGDALPDHPTPLVVMDKRGRPKWTISIPSSYDFPLSQEAYVDICEKTSEASTMVYDMHHHKKMKHQAHYGYYHVDEYFMDVKEAVDAGLLPKPGALHRGSSKAGSERTMVGLEAEDLADAEVCERSMTFVMESNDAGLGRSLMMLWTAYGLAQKEGRSFFIDDSRWAYGNYKSYFRPPPVPSCRPPPRHEVVPCPHHARHLLVSSSTAAWTFGGQFNEEFENPKKMEVFRQEPIFQLARVGYEALFHLSTSDAVYVASRVASFRKQTSLTMNVNNEEDAQNESNGLLIGIQIRHGDRHPLEFQYSDAYIPTDTYANTAREVLYQHFNNSATNGEEDLMAEMKSLMLIASDDPTVYESIEFSHSPRAQDLIDLKSVVSTGTPHPPALQSSVDDHDEADMFKRFVESPVGWEGGFFAGMFWSLGRTTPSGAGKAGEGAMSASETQLSSETIRLRELVGRSYLLDLAVLASSDRIVCAVSAGGCKLLAVMMGWERAIVNKEWINVDGDFEWRGIRW